MEIPTGGIGFFDSGAGGLTVLFSCLDVIKDFPVYYYGDNARAPYGNLPDEKIFSYAAEAFDEFERLKARAVVVACNTVTAVCADEFRKKYPFPVVGAEPAVFPAAKRGGLVFVLCTRATFESERFRDLCARAEEKYPDAEIRAFACDGLAGEVEKRLFSDDRDFTSFFPRGNPDAVVLGCTHYVFLKREIASFYRCPVYDGNDGIARRLASLLSLSPTNTNVCFSQNSKNRDFLPENRGDFRIFFLGSGKNVDKRRYEQMFVLQKVVK